VGRALFHYFGTPRHGEMLMKLKGLKYLFLTGIAALMFLCVSIEGLAQVSHLFYGDVKEAYKDSRLTYDSKVERILYSKLPKPQALFEQRGFSSELPKPKNPEEEQIMIKTIKALHRQFFKKVKTGQSYCPIERITKEFDQTPEERIGISSGGYYRLFVAYWTFNIKLEENRQINILKHGYGNVYYIDSFLRSVEIKMAGAFFPTPGPNEIPENLRRQGIQELLNMFAPTMTIKELYEGADPQKVRWPVLK
jgi:hypothetical protein